MKLVGTLPERPGFLHVCPVLDLFLLVVLFFMVGPSLVLQSGVMVDLAPSRFQMERYEDTLVVTLGAGEVRGQIHLGRLAVSFEELEQLLDAKRADGSAAKAMVLLQSAADLPVTDERRVAEMILAKGYRLALVGRSVPSEPETAEPQDDSPRP